jgi:hypothetical protein
MEKRRLTEAHLPPDILRDVEKAESILVHHGVTVLLVKGRSYAQPDPRAFADAILRRE